MVITFSHDFAVCSFSAPKLVFLIFDARVLDIPRKEKKQASPAIYAWVEQIVNCIYFFRWSFSFYSVKCLLHDFCCFPQVFSGDTSNWLFSGGSETAFKKFCKSCTLWVRHLSCSFFPRVLVDFLPWSSSPYQVAPFVLVMFLFGHDPVQWQAMPWPKAFFNN